MAKKKKVAKPTDTEPPLSFEKSLERVATIVNELESGQLGLSDSLARYEEGIGHLKHCQKQLERAESKVAMLTGFDADGNPVTEDLDTEELTLEEKAKARSSRRSKSSEVRPKPISHPKSDTDSEVDLPGGLF